MSGKKVTMGPRPTTKAGLPSSADAWVESRDAAGAAGDGPEPTKRLTIDIPASLHRAVKTDCAQQGITIADVVRDLLSQKYRKP